MQREAGRGGTVRALPFGAHLPRGASTFDMRTQRLAVACQHWQPDLEDAIEAGHVPAVVVEVGEGAVVVGQEAFPLRLRPGRYPAEPKASGAGGV